MILMMDRIYWWIFEMIDWIGHRLGVVTASDLMADQLTELEMANAYLDDLRAESLQETGGQWLA